MAKYELTITDMESGEIKLKEACDGIMAATTLRNSMTPSTTSFAQSLSGVDVLALLVALDMMITATLAGSPVLAEAYALRDEIFNDRIAIDIGALEKQMGEL